ncbi:hypothetical protein ACHAWF_018102 [Thalassiosira exigua]
MRRCQRHETAAGRRLLLAALGVGASRSGGGGGFVGCALGPGGGRALFASATDALGPIAPRARARTRGPSAAFVAFPPLLAPSAAVRARVGGGTSRRRLLSTEAASPSGDPVVEGRDRRPARRRRRGAMHSARGGRLAASSDREPSTTTTRYTIDDSVCPPTDPATLERIVTSHVRALPKHWKARPVTAEAFEVALEFVVEFGRRRIGEGNGGEGGDMRRVDVILDRGCGTGRSTFLLGRRHEDCAVIGIDRSLARLSRNRSYNGTDLGDDANVDGNVPERLDNVLLLRADLPDFWRLCLSSPEWRAQTRVVAHYLLYPNPYPKGSRLKKRFYAHPSFPLLMMMMGHDYNEDNDNEKDVDGGDGERRDPPRLVVRSNWRGYLEEFRAAAMVWSNVGGTYDNFATTIHKGEDSRGSEEWIPGPKARRRWVASALMRLDASVGGDSDKTIEFEPWTNFEAKYLACGEPVCELILTRQEDRPIV